MSGRFRQEYRELTDEEKALIKAIKDHAEAMAGLIDEVHGKYGEKGGVREAALAMTKLEECVMWAVKGIT